MDQPEQKELQEKTFWQLSTNQQLSSVNDSPPPLPLISSKLPNKNNSLLNNEERTVKQELSATNTDEIQNYNNTGEAAILAKQEFLQLLLQITPEEVYLIVRILLDKYRKF